MVLKQLGAGPELLHCHVTLTVETFVTCTVTSVGVGGAEMDRGTVAISEAKIKLQSYKIGDNG